jgi:hypothetical protein
MALVTMVIIMCYFDVRLKGRGGIHTFPIPRGAYIFRAILFLNPTHSNVYMPALKYSLAHTFLAYWYNGRNCSSYQEFG